jgi:dihydrofolate reductase
MIDIPLVFVVAMGENRVIGRDNQMPWHLRSDLKRFRALTWGKPMIMGRKTFQSIGKPLPGRESIVVTTAPDFHVDGVHVVHSVEAAVERARELSISCRADEISVIGGGEIFRQLMSEADRLEVTIVHSSPAGDAYFPEIDPGQWTEEKRETHEAGEKDDHAFTYVTYVPRASSDVT